MSLVRPASAVAILLALGCAGEDKPTAALNRPPVVQPIADQRAQVGDTLQILVSAEDPEGDTVTYGLVVPWIPGAGIADASVDSLSGHFRFVPKPTDGSLRWFGIYARDSQGAEESADFYVLIG